MTAPTDALRAECEKALAEFIAREIDAGDPTKKAADWFRAGFNVLAARVSEQDAEIAILRKASNHTGCMEEKAAQLAQREAEVERLRAALAGLPNHNEENYRLKNPTAEKLSPDESWCWCTHKHAQPRPGYGVEEDCTECQCNRYDPMPGKA